MKRYLPLIIFLLFSFASFAQNADSTWFVNNVKNYITGVEVNSVK